MKLLLLFLTIFNLTNYINPDSEPFAVETLAKISNKYSKYKSLQLFFSYKQTDIESKESEQQNGILFLKTGLNKYKIETDKAELFASQDLIYTYLKEQNEVYISDIDKNFKTLNPLDLIHIDPKNSNYKIISTDGTDNNIIAISIFVLQEYPFYKIEFLINKNNLTIKKINFKDKSGFYYEYTILKENHDINLADDFFIFKKEHYPNVEVIDYRLLEEQHN